MEFWLRNAKYAGAALALAGFVALAMLLPEEQFTTVNSIEKKDVGKKISTTGIVEGLRIEGKNAFFSLEDNGRIRAVLFGATGGTAALANLKDGSVAEVSGVVGIYNNELEIIVEKVRRVD